MEYNYLDPVPVNEQPVPVPRARLNKLDTLTPTAVPVPVPREPDGAGAIFSIRTRAVGLRTRAECVPKAGRSIHIIVGVHL